MLAIHIRLAQSRMLLPRRYLDVRVGKLITLLASNEFKSIGAVFTRSIVSKLFAEISKVSCISEKPRWQARGSVQVATIIEFVSSSTISLICSLVSVSTPPYTKNTFLSLYFSSIILYSGLPCFSTN